MNKSNKAIHPFFLVKKPATTANPVPTPASASLTRIVADSSKRAAPTSSSASKKQKSSDSGDSNYALSPNKQHNQSWQHALKPYVANPEQFGPEVVVDVSREVVVIVDKYPKARLHFLALPRVHECPADIRGLTNLHLPLLGSLQDAFVRIQETRPNMKLRAGFHSVPSMAHLHLHIISEDLISPSLKNKRHYNSFATSFFRPLNQVIAEINEFGRIQIGTEEECEALLKIPLVCYKCQKNMKNIPELKKHLETEQS
ncbi:hypothetical protein HK100_010087 [Physocladia obscura]|uniref:Aprataxin C2HE/C2H2/C2HC zinc finger domain-containing protein n=1 Tax=Physocladia obscura TaxID=109957 RepID=A0AAD5T8U0_9FUNG|nr:hypothetical protein HK100_010087 [Physocladia obscura]